MRKLKKRITLCFKVTLKYKVTFQEKALAEQDKDLATILEDVKTIKSILLNTDAPLPPVWRLIYFIAFPAIVLIGLLKFFVPALAGLTFLGGPARSSTLPLPSRL